MRKTVVVALLLGVFALSGALLASAAQPEKKSAAIAQLQKQVGKLTARVKALERDADANFPYLENRMDRIEATASQGLCLGAYISDYLGRLQAALPAENRPANGPPRVKGGCL